jgi:Protein of unknown function (DUF3306)
MPMDDPAEDAGFLSRWSRRKAMTRDAKGATETPAVPSAPAVPAAAPGIAPGRAVAPNAAESAPQAATAAETVPAQPAPTLDDVARLTPASDFSRFVAPGVDSKVRNAALKQLFADPHFNIMDGLDIYIDDYGKPDPLPAGVLRKMVQAEFLNLFADETKAQAESPAAATAPPREISPDEDPDLRLQPHDAAGPPGPEPGPGEDAGGQH